MNRLQIDKRVQVISALVEGTSINATSRITGVAKHTILKLLKDMGCASAAYHDAHVRNLRVRRVQADEVWSFVYGKDKNLTMEQIQAGAPEPFHANGDAPIYSPNKCVQQEIRESRTHGCAVFLSLQFYKDS